MRSARSSRQESRQDTGTFRARLDAIYALAVPMLVMDLLGTAMILWCFWTPGHATALTLWFAACVTVIAARTVMAVGYRRYWLPTRTERFWAGSLIGFATVGGLLWGGALAWMVATGTAGQVSFVLCVALAGVALSVAHITFWPFYAAFAAPLTGGIAIGFALSSRPDSMLLAFGAVAMTVGLLVVTRRLSDELLRAYRLAAENSALVDDLAARGAELEQALAALEKVSRTDPLTGLANRRWRDDRLDAEWTRARRRSTDVAVIAIDVDRFKAFNDLLGHDEGDRCLKAVAEALRAETRQGVDLAARHGGEEFMLVLPGMDATQAAGLAERVRLRVADCWHAVGLAQRVTISLGVASRNPASDGGSTAELMRAADMALYRAKLAGRNRHDVATIGEFDSNAA